MAEKAKSKKSFGARVKDFFGAIQKFFRDTVSEMKKVVWPSRKDTVRNSGVVIGVVVAAAVVLLILDSVFGLVLRLIIGA